MKQRVADYVADFLVNDLFYKRGIMIFPSHENISPFLLEEKIIVIKKEAYPL